MASKIIGADTSLLVAHSLIDHPSHPAAERIVSSILGREELVAICPVVLDEFIHVVTDRRRFERPLEMASAINLARTWYESKETLLLCPSDQSLQLQLDWMHRHRLGRKRLHDTQIAAIYHLAGVKTLVSSNWRDFRVFECFDIQVLS